VAQAILALAVKVQQGKDLTVVRAAVKAVLPVVVRAARVAMAIKTEVAHIAAPAVSAWQAASLARPRCTRRVVVRVSITVAHSH
jgi:hypothetical protein